MTIQNSRRKSQTGGIGRAARFSFLLSPFSFAPRRLARAAGQILEEYVLLLGLIGVPLLLALPTLVGAMRDWAGRLLTWWNLPVP